MVNWHEYKCDLMLMGLQHLTNIKCLIFNFIIFCKECLKPSADISFEGCKRCVLQRRTK
jgi:hypothetical protein